MQEEEGKWTAGLKQLVAKVFVTHSYLINIFEILCISTDLQNLFLQDSEHLNYNAAPHDKYLSVGIHLPRDV